MVCIISKSKVKKFMSLKQSNVMQLRVLKLITFCLLAICLQVNGNSYAQNVTLSVRNVPIQKVFREITRQTGVSIVYRESMLAGLAPVTLDVRNASLDEVLTACLKGQPVSFQLVGKSIVIKENQPVAV